MTTLIAFIIVLGVLIFIHEFGHFFFAKMAGVRVLKFSLGFGPVLASKTIGETEYALSAIPLGGFVKMFGENLDEQDISEADRDASFIYKPLWKRFLIVLAGPLFNLLFPILLFFCVFLVGGVPSGVNMYAEVGGLVKSSPADRAGVQEGDLIREIDGTRIEKWSDVVTTVGESKGEKLDFLLEREGKQVELTITPEKEMTRDIFGKEAGERWLVGINGRSDVIYTRVGPVDSLKEATLSTWNIFTLILKGMEQLVLGNVPASQLGGPILIAQEAGNRLQHGWGELAFFMGLISINLGILNLLPIPVLDGGHLMFFTIEAITRKPMNEKVMVFAQQIGVGLLGTLIIFAFYNDIMRLIG
ncbi:RIP metalloprotease RseP [Desulforhopalus vacuolatus]|uniref:RIP metalloprotease RseP n=1 Tax=Desulforhopalus vacuolatus TaxID=40414 RepID=UPI001962D3D1|nr:RIP metalloprotease RseP [Desulforhopalus vacuolatus]MBM9518811.1 RIP metalloprotease RseP [Desulforhopalus vacuolatus]